jgi:malonyl CoA-acyl carrier protein transacylase
MPKYRVEVSGPAVGWVEVEAIDGDEAERLARTQFWRQVNWYEPTPVDFDAFAEEQE